MEKRNCAIALLASLILLFTGIATASTVINYQGLLTDAAGDPVPDSTYQMRFSIWDDSTGGTQVWLSPLNTVATSNGRFSVNLGATEPLDRDMLGSGPVYLEIQLETEPPLDPRTRLNWVPYGAVAQRVLGDVETSEGSLTVQLENAEQTPFINLNVDSAQANVMLSSGYPDGPGINMVLTETFEGMSADLTLRGENGSTNVGMGAGPEVSFFDVMYQIPLVADMRGIEISAESTSASVAIVRELPDTEPPFTLFEASANDSMTQLNMRGLDLTNGPSVNMQVTLTTEAYDAGMTFVGAEGGPSLKMGADPDAVGIIVINDMPSGDSGSIILDVNPTTSQMIIEDNRQGEPGENTSIALSADGSFAKMIIEDNKPSGDGASINIGVEQALSQMIIEDNRQGTPDENTVIALSADGSFAKMIIEDNMPTGDSAAIEIGASSNMADVNIYFGSPPGDQRQGINMTVDSAGAGMVIYQAPTELSEDIGTPMFSVNGMPNSGVSAKIFNPLLEPPSHDPMIEMGTASGNNASINLYQPQSEAPGDLYEAIVLSNTVNGGSRAPGASVKMFQPQPEPPGLPAAIQMAAQTNNTLFDVFKYTQDATGIMDSVGMHMGADSSEVSMEFLRGANTWVKMFANDSSGGVEFFDDGSKYMGVEPSPFYDAGDLKMYDSAQATSIIISSLGQVSIGTGVMGNILTILRNSPTDPIADAWTTYSSRRWKRNIEPIEGSLDKVMNLRGVSFEWKDNGMEDIGLIAEEVAEVIPEVVVFEENSEDAKSVDYARLVALLIEATKEQQKEIEELKSEIEELKTRVN
jgi:hypothetical protein